MKGRTCHHCKQWVEPGEAHDCWTTTEEALTEDLSEDLREAWERVRETAAAEGEQRIYASHHCIMFARRTAYFFVRPKRSYLELCVFLHRTVQAPQIRRVTRVSSTRLAHIVQVRHRDEVEAPLTDWIAEAYALQDAAPPPGPTAATAVGRRPAVVKRKRAKAERVPAASAVKAARRAVVRTAPRRRRKRPLDRDRSDDKEEK
jgi:hypothetical protein